MKICILHGDCRERMSILPDASIQCVVTSPPYWGLRDYGLPPVTWSDGVSCALGLEPTPEDYVAHLVDVFRSVRRVLRDDGTVWLNLGDSYNAYNGNRGSTTGFQGAERERPKIPGGYGLTAKGLKPKDLVGIPWRVAFALQADGWYLRSDIIWAKGYSFHPTTAGSCMPESITDRPTCSHEHMFLLTKNDKYYYDRDAVKEASLDPTDDRKSRQSREDYDRRLSVSATVRTVINTKGSSTYPTRNLRSVWIINPKPYKDAHFATFPPALVEPCIRAGTSEKGQCTTCGAPVVRHVEKGEANIEQRSASGADASGGYTGQSTKDYAAARAQDASATKARILDGMREHVSTWHYSCDCGVAAEPQVVLDPFVGSGTTGVVAIVEGRNFVGIDANSDYVEMARRRILSGGKA